MARGTRNGDSRIELVHIAVADRPAGPVGKGEPPERVERRHLRTSSGVEDLHREEGHERLVVMDDVEPLPIEHAGHKPLQTQGEGDPSDRAVVGDGDRLTDLDNVLSRRVVAPRRGDDPNIVPQAAELLVAFADVRVRPAGPRIRVWRNNSDLH